MLLSFKTDEKSINIVLTSLLRNNNLNNWEKSFVDNINNKFKANFVLTTNQLEKLSNIWDKY